MPHDRIDIESLARGIHSASISLYLRLRQDHSHEIARDIVIRVLADLLEQYRGLEEQEEDMRGNDEEST